MQKTAAWAIQTYDARTRMTRRALEDERRLVAQASRHDQQAFAQLYGRYMKRIFRYIYSKVGSSALAEDMTAQVFLKAWMAMKEYSYTNRPFTAWLYRIAHNLIVDYFRTYHETLSLEDCHDPQERGDTVEEIAEKHLNSEMLKRALTRLTREQQQVLTFKFLLGYCTDDLAEIMGKDPAAVRALQHRGLQSLQRILISFTLLK